MGLVSPRASKYQGPTSIVNLVTESLQDEEVVNSSLMVHIPQYVQLDEDHMGAARLVEVLCAMYGFPTTLADTTRGSLQYQEIDKAVENNEQVARFVKQLESAYDKIREATAEGTTEGAELSPEVEDFLRQMGQRLDDGAGDQRGAASS